MGRNLLKIIWYVTIVMDVNDTIFSLTRFEEFKRNSPNAELIHFFQLNNVSSQCYCKPLWVDVVLVQNWVFLVCMCVKRFYFSPFSVWPGESWSGIEIVFRPRYGRVCFLAG